MRLILAVFLMLSGYAYAGCANISDSDQRNYCNAKSGNGSCASINNWVQPLAIYEVHQG